MSPYISELPVEAVTLTIERGEKRFDVMLTPYEDQFVDQQGIKRQYGVLGVIVDHAPLPLRAVISVNGIEAEDKDHARDLLIDHFDQDVLLLLAMTDNRDSEYRTKIYAKNNQHLFDEDHREYKNFYLGELKNNFYEEKDLWDAIVYGSDIASDMFINIVTVSYTHLTLPTSPKV